ncbi:efflux RND transporter periplasmic adaptor subunit [Novosphingobium sp. 1949]|uniref:Efflux RND transporter periplasmic adaptor subunit n=1 Tax=Novosphingobium organovorum TaxID=2930092 RepID=A0ABT0BF19_9SPHN|nr:efflux RND transporter periplasmic adaptor subunit [Novosphingobium organovorum]MCJ2183647.1 efflux RND transporter periplasmic adaptor subunit [Novosphingobium organovorum]
MSPLRTMIPASALMLCACSQDKPAKDERRPVAVLTVSEDSQTNETTYAGEIRSAFESQVGFEVPGRITARTVDPGDLVRAGQDLMRLDPGDYARALDSATAQSHSAQTAAATQRADLARSRELLDKGFISPAEFDQQKAQTAQAQAQLRTAAAQRGTAAAQMDRTRLRAPRSGVVTQVQGEVGQVVGAGQGVVTLADDRRPEIAVALPEGGLEQVRQVTALSVSVWSHPGKRYPAHLRTIAGAADPTTRTFAARISIEAPPETLLMGETAQLHVRIRSGHGAMDVPLTAVWESHEATGSSHARVWVVDRKAMTVAPRPVRLGAPGGEIVRITKGLNAGETIVTAGVQLLHSGEKVRIVKVPSS